MITDRRLRPPFKSFRNLETFGPRDPEPSLSFEPRPSLRASGER